MKYAANKVPGPMVIGDLRRCPVCHKYTHYVSTHMTLHEKERQKFAPRL